MSHSRGYDDELISAYLDGEADPDEAARMDRDPQAAARAAELAAVQAAVADPVPPLDAPERNRLRAAALNAAAPAARPISAARRIRPGAFIPVAAAAGIAAVVVGAIAVLQRLDDSRGDMTAASDPASAPAPAAQSSSDDSSGDMALAGEAEMGDGTGAGDMAFAEEEGAEMADAAGDEDMAIAEETEMADDSGGSAVATTMAEMDTAPAAEPAAEALDPAGDGADPGPTDLGLFAGLEQLTDRLAPVLTDGDDLAGPYTESGPCAGAVAERIAELSAEMVGEARAELEESTEASPGGAVDLTVAATGDGGMLLVYAVEPDCEVEVAALE